MKMELSDMLWKKNLICGYNLQIIDIKLVEPISDYKKFSWVNKHSQENDDHANLEVDAYILF